MAYNTDGISITTRGYLAKTNTAYQVGAINVAGTISFPSISTEI